MASPTALGSVCFFLPGGCGGAWLGEGTNLFAGRAFGSSRLDQYDLAHRDCFPERFALAAWSRTAGRDSSGCSLRLAHAANLRARQQGTMALRRRSQSERGL